MVKGIRLDECSDMPVIGPLFVEDEIEGGTKDAVSYIEVVPQGRATSRRK